jgi:hypothetical protein
MKSEITDENRKKMDEFDKLTNKAVKSIMTGQILYNSSHELQFTQYNTNEVKKYLNLLLPALKKKEKDFDMLFDKNDASTKDVYDLYNFVINQLCEMIIPDFLDLSNILLAFKKDREALLETINDILK